MRRISDMTPISVSATASGTVKEGFLTEQGRFALMILVADELTSFTDM
jgi:hypothetical protein